MDIKVRLSLPFIQNNPDEIPIKSSTHLRITAIALGTILFLIGILLNFAIPGLGAIGIITGWSLFSFGVVLTLTGLFLKIVKTQPKLTEETTGIESGSPNQANKVGNQEDIQAPPPKKESTHSPNSSVLEEETHENLADAARPQQTPMADLTSTNILNVESTLSAPSRIEESVQSFPTHSTVVERVNHYILSDSLFEQAKQCIDNPSQLSQLPHPSNGASRDRIYLPQDMPIVIRFCENPTDIKRFSKMDEAHAICEKIGSRHLIIPNARVHGNFIIEDRLPNENDSAIKGMAFYYENQSYYTEAIAEFTSFLCYGNLTDIAGNDAHSLRGLGLTLIPRFDNLLLYSVIEQSQQVYKIGFIDLETLYIHSENPTLEEVKKALWVSIQLFPYHFDTIIATGKSLCYLPAETIDELTKLCQKSRQLYKIVCEDNSAYYKKNTITFETPIFHSLTESKMEELKKNISHYL